MKKILIFLLLVSQLGQAQNLFARQNFAGVNIPFNTEIGGVSGTITSSTQLAIALGISSTRVQNFTVVGSDIKCKITGGSYDMIASAFGSNTSLTYYTDLANLVSSFTDANTFGGCTSLNRIQFNGLTNIVTSYIFNNTPLLPVIELPALASCGAVAFAGAGAGANFVKTIYIPNCTNLGGSSGNNSVFSGIGAGSYIYCNPVLATNNAGAPDGDLVGLTGVTIRYVSNFTAPSAITDLSAGTIYNTAIQLNFTPPSSTNTIDYYECYANGVFKNRITGSGEYVAGLTASTNYDITVKAVDIFLNKSAVSNTLNVTTNTTSAIPTTGLVSYYKLDSNSNDSVGSNNGTDTAISYVTGKVNNAASFNGTSSTIVKASSSFDFFGSQNVSFSCWFKATSMPSTLVDLVSIQEVGNPTIIDKTIRLYNNGSVSFYCYDGASKVAQTISGLATTGVWYHIVGTFDGSNLRVYFNGELRAILACTGSFNFTAPQLTFGKSAAGVFNGLIDEVPIYSTALTQNQVDILFNNGAGTTL